MKLRKNRFAIIATSALLLTPTAFALDGTWINPAGGSWNTANPNWSGDQIAGGVGYTAYFTADVPTTNTTVNLDGVRTIGNLVFSDTDTTSAGTWIIATGTGGPLTLDAGLSSPTITVNALGSSRFARIDAVLAGTNGFTKTGAGNLLLNNASNSISGSVVLSQGNIQLNTAALTNATTVTLNGGTLVVATGTDAIGGEISFNGGLLQHNNAPAATDYSAKFSTAANQNYRISVTSGASVVTYSTNLSSAGGTLEKAGAGKLILAAANTFTGATKVAAGNLALSNALALQNSALDAANSVTGTASAGIILSGVTTPTFGGLTGNQALASLFDTDDGGYAGVTNLTLNPGTGANYSYSGAIANGAANMTLTKTGAGTQTLSVANSYSGGTILSAGTLNIGNASALGSGGLTFTGNSILQAGGAYTVANAIGVNSGVTGTVDTNGNATTLSGALTGDGDLTKTGAGILTLTGGTNNTLSGTININAGRIASTDGTSFKNMTGTVTVASGASFQFSQAFTANNLTNDLNLSGAGNNANIGALHIYGNATASGAITLGADTTITHSFNNAWLTGSVTGTDRNLTLKTTEAGQPGLTVSAPIQLGTGGITVTGAANSGNFSVLLSGDNSYSGGTTVTAGSLLVNNTTGSGTGSGAVTVNSGATLGGSGRISGAVNVSGVLSPGESIESLGTGTLTLDDESNFKYELNSATVAGDLLHVTGDLNIGSNVTLDLTDLAALSQALTAGTKLTLLSYSGLWDNGTFNGYADDSTFVFANNEWLINYNDLTGGSNFTSDQTGATSFVTLTVIPEPSSLLLGLCGLGALLLRRSRGN